jgi:transcriptional regulator with XRE-family HTH domain
MARTTGFEAEPQRFADWLSRELRARGMSQRQLARQAGVEHSTISRLIRSGRTPSLSTATKLARVLGELGGDAKLTANERGAHVSASHPIARVEYALRSDEMLSERDVRRVMREYLTTRSREPGRSR